jgi:ribosomal protein S18 acetylase RimI-like enzyme
LTENRNAGPEVSAGGPRQVQGVRTRLATAADVPSLATLLVRLKRLNAEFDPLLAVRPDAEEQAVRVLEADLKNPRSVVLTAESVEEGNPRIVGVVRATVRERPFYVPEMEGVILDIYLLPAHRRGGVGEFLLAEATRHLKEKGAGLVTAEFPSLNEIATRFYAKRGFRPITSLHARRI